MLRAFPETSAETRAREISVKFRQLYRQSLPYVPSERVKKEVAKTIGAPLRRAISQTTRRGIVSSSFHSSSNLIAQYLTEQDDRVSSINNFWSWERRGELEVWRN